MSDGAINDGQISCGHAYIDPSQPFCGKCIDARDHSDETRREIGWWCTKNAPSAESLWFQVTFPHLTYVSSMKLQTYSDLLDKTKEYFPHNFTVMYSRHTDRSDDFVYFYGGSTEKEMVGNYHTAIFQFDTPRPFNTLVPRYILFNKTFSCPRWLLMS